MAGVGTAVAFGAASLIGGAMSAGKAQKSADAARVSQERMAAADLGFRQMVYNEEKQRRAEQDAYIKPIRNALTAKAFSQDNPFFQDQKGLIERGYTNAGVATEEKLGQNGQRDGGLGAAMRQGLEINKARDLSTAWKQGKQQQLALAGQLLGMPQDARPLEAANGVGQAYGNFANMYGQNAQLFQGMANSAWGSAAQGAGNAMNLVGKSKGWW